MVTLKDVSREVGVSITQVSRALAGYPDVKEETRQRIVEASERLGYRPNALARGLKTGRSGIVAMVVPGDWAVEESTVLLEIVTGLSTEISGRGMRFVLHVAAPGEDVREAHDELIRGGGIDGFVVIQPARGGALIKGLAKSGIPFVVHGNPGSGAHPHVDIDNAAVGADLLSRLLDLGHRRVLFLNGPKGALFAEARDEGVAWALAGAGLGADTVRTEHGPMTETQGREATRSALRRPDRPTAIMAGNVMLARGVYDAAAAMGLRIPQDLSVLAHDDGLRGYEPEGFVPVLGGTRSPLAAAWVALADALKARIEHGEASIENRILPHEFNAGGSTSEIQG
ncbi:MAG: LacI family transcriptional regulator [Limimaricola cinnabarinus]|jgi:LacI family transcriptional regulator|uniref:substrate-binding domain-containing protein n=1 Tax=Limimaricola cinnabarinus TaxID=1125964 RepID=UPI0039E213E6